MFASSTFAALPVATSSVDAEYLGAHTITLVEGRANEVTVPHVLVQAVNTRLQVWNDISGLWVPSASTTRISEFCKQVNQRYLGSTTLNPDVIARCESIDGDTGNRLVYTPGATPVGSAQDFAVIIPDQDGDYESRGFVIFLNDDANSNPGIDNGEVRIRLTNFELPWS